MTQIKPRRFTKNEVKAIMNSAFVLRKKKEGEEFYNSEAFKTHRRQIKAERLTAEKKG